VGRDGLGGRPVDTLEGEIDEREVGVVLDAHERARRRRVDTGSGETLVDERLRERARAGPRARSGQAVRGDEARRLEQVGNELGDDVRRDAGARRGRRLDARGLLVTLADAAQVLKIVEFHLNGLSA
jgi:hypothetical protein